MPSARPTTTIRRLVTLGFARISAAPMRPSVVRKTVMVGHGGGAREASLQRGVRGRVHSDPGDRDHDLLTHREAGVRHAEVPTVDGGRGVGARAGAPRRWAVDVRRYPGAPP